MVAAAAPVDAEYVKEQAELLLALVTQNVITVDTADE
jgi:hypothetical protein